MIRVDRIATRRRRQGAWLSTCAMAIALASCPQGARAQSFQGTPTVVTGSAGIVTGTGTTTIGLGSAQTVINWAPTDVAGAGTIDFQPAGTTATFQARAPFVVLNRILPTDAKGNPSARMVGFNGTVNSTLIGASGVTAGEVWFYTPTGFVIGPTATMTVGGLILTTDDIQFTPNDPTTGINGTVYGPGGVIQFRGSAGSAGLIDVQAGAALSALGTNSYIAMVAPRIQQGGTVSAERDIGYIAAEQVDLTINAGLFDISILAGTTDSNGIVHTGTTTGTASTSGFDTKTISFVAMPKTTALTMLLSGSIGYAPAVDAANDGSAVVLSSGYSTAQPASEVPGSLGNISIDNASFSNPLVSAASGMIGITGAGGPVSFGAYTNLFAQDRIDVTLAANQQLTAASSLTLRAGHSGTGGIINIGLGNKASFAVTNFLDLDASTFASTIAAPAVNATGGSITVDVNGGTLSSSGMYATTFADAGFDPVTGGTGVGGSVSLTARNGGAITGGDFEATAEGIGGGSDGAGGNGTGGSVGLTSLGGALNFGSVLLNASGYAGAGGVLAGTATGGTASILLNGGTYAWTDLYAAADANGAYSTVAGSQGNSATARPDAVTLTLANNASLAVANDIDLSATALATVNAPAGASAKGGGITVDVGPGASLGFTNFTSYAEGAFYLSYFDGITPTTTPDMFGGTISLTNAGQVTGHSISLFADAAQLGASSAAGKATGGKIDMLVNNGGNVTLDDGFGTAVLLLDAGAKGAIGTSAANAFGGSATLTLDDGTVNVAGSVTVGASGQWHQGSVFFGSGPDPKTGFNSTGGLATVQLLAGTSGTAALTATSLEVNATGDATTPAFNFINLGDGGPPSGTYGGPMAANAGDGTGGMANLSVAGGTLNVSDVTVKSQGLGGISDVSTLGTPFQSGNGLGGNASFGVTGGTSAIANLSIDASGYGGGGSPAAGAGQLGALAGDGTGGNALLTIGGGSLNANSLNLDGTGTGGAGTDNTVGGAATDGGNGSGGTAKFASPSGATGQLTNSNAFILAGGFGGAGGTSPGGTNGNGGNGVGGVASTDLQDGAFTLGPLTLGADGVGGDGAIGGRGTGGSSNFKLVDSVGPSGARTIGSLSLYANGVGGAGAGGAGPGDAGSTGLDVEAFDAASGVTVSGDLAVEATGSNAPVGEGFVALIAGAPLEVGGNTTITTTRDVTIGTFTPLHTAGNVQVTGRSVDGFLLSADGTISIFGDQGIGLGTLTSGGTTSLQSPNGAITINHLTSAGDVFAVGRAVSTFSNGSITFSNLRATAGDLQIVAQGDLTTAGASATGNIILSSQGGALSSSTPISAGGYVSLIGTNGITAGTVISGGTTDLTADSGAISITDLQSAGAITASGRVIDIGSTTDLLFNVANATSGHLNLTGLSLSATGPLTASGNVNINATNGISLNFLTSGGTTSLRATNGDIFVPGLESAGLVTARGRSILINSSGALTFGTATATAGNLTIGAALGLTANGALSAAGNVLLSGNGGITAGTVVSGGTTALGSANGNIVVTDLQSAGSVSASGHAVNLLSTQSLTVSAAEATGGGLSLTALQLTATGPLSATGNVAIDAANGIALGSLTSGGTTGLTSDGAISATNLNSAGNVTAVGSSLDLTSNGALTFDVAKATGGNLAIGTAGDLALANASSTGGMTLSSSGGSIGSTGSLTSGSTFSASGASGLNFASLSTAGATTLTATGGAITIADLAQAGSIVATGRSIDIGSSGGLTFNQVTATAGNLTLATAGALTVNGASSATGNVSLSGKTGLTSHGTLRSGGTTRLTSIDGTVSVDSLTSTGLVTTSGRAIDITSPTALSFDSANATAGALSIAASGGLTLSSASASSDLALTTVGGKITVAGDVSGRNVTLNATLDLSVGGNLLATGNLGVDTRGSFSVGGDTSSARANIIADTGISLGAFNATGDVVLKSGDGDVVVNDLVTPSSITASGGSVTIASTSGLRFAGVNAFAGDARLTAGGDVTGNGNLSATGVLSVDAQGSFTLSAIGTGASIAVTSNDIQLAAGSRLGTRGTTQDITLTNRDRTRTSNIGGAGGAGGYELDSAEAARLFADKSITLASTGDFSIGDLRLSFGGTGNVGTGGSFEITTPGNVQVNGAVKLTTSSNDDTFKIDPARIDVVAGQGSIAMLSSSDAAQGTIDLTADTVAVLTPATRDAISGLTDLGQISKKLDTSADPEPAGGYLQAGTIRVSANNAFLVQNGGASSAFADRRGFTANALDITTGSAATQIAINGVILQSGDPVTGLATIPLVTINGRAAAAGGLFDPLSTINGCVIGADCAAPPRPEEPPVTNPTDNDLTSPLDHPTGQVFNSELFSLAANAPLITPPLVDEPITGVGNDDLWISGCADNSDDKRCSDKKGGE